MQYQGITMVFWACSMAIKHIYNAVPWYFLKYQVNIMLNEYGNTYKSTMTLPRYFWTYLAW